MYIFWDATGSGKDLFPFDDKPETYTRLFSTSERFSRGKVVLFVLSEVIEDTVEFLTATKHNFLQRIT